MSRTSKLLTSISLAFLMAVPGVVSFSGKGWAVGNIVVTTRKREELVQDVPISVTAFSANDIQRNQVRDLRDITNLVPGFEFVQALSREFDRPVIRGQSNIFAESGVATFVDGLYFNGAISTLNLNDIQTLEVIRGPQSALYGRNTYAGALNITTRRPGDEWRANLVATAAQHEEFEVAGGISGPIIADILSAGINGRFYEYGGQFTNLFDGSTIGKEETQSISATINFTPTERISVLARVNYSNVDDGVTETSNTFPATNNAFFETGGDTIGHYFIGELTATQPNVDTSFLSDPGFREERWDIGLRIDWEVTDALTLTSVSGYEDLDQNLDANVSFANPSSAFLPIVAFFPLAVPGPWNAIGVTLDTVQEAVELEETWQTELRAEWDNGGRIRAMLGGYYYKNNASERETLDNSIFATDPAFLAEVAAGIADADARCAAVNSPFFTACTGAFLNFTPTFLFPFIGPSFYFDFVDDRESFFTETQNWAIFGKVEVDLTEQFTVIAEGRYQEESFDVLRRDPMGVITDTGSDTFTKFAPRFTIEWSPTEDTLVYFVAANGTKPGGANEGGGFDIDIMEPIFAEETIWSYELGTKNTLFDGQLIFNAAGYYNFISGYQLTDTVILSTGDTDSIIRNKGKVEVYGVEVAAVYSPEAVEGLTLNMAYAWNDSKFKTGDDAEQGELDDILDDGLLNCSFAGSSDPGGCDPANTSIVGQRLPRSAQHQLSAGFLFTQCLCFVDQNEVDWFVGTDVSYTSSKFVQVHNLAEFGAATLLNARVGIETENIIFTVWGKNLLDEDSVISASRFVDFANFERSYFHNLRRGRQWGGTMSASF